MRPTKGGALCHRMGMRGPGSRASIMWAQAELVPRALCSYPAPSSQDFLPCGQQTHGWPRVTCSDLTLHMQNMVMQPHKGLASFLVILCSSAHNSPTAMSFDPYLLSCSLMWASLYQRPWGISRPFPTNHF